MLLFFLVLSLIFNIFLVWFLYRLLNRHSYIISMVEDIQFKINLFSNHLENLYELEIFYGEPTIQKLIEHSKILLSSFVELNEDYDMFIREEQYEQLQEKVENERGD